jgi:hypothetical protein
MSRNFLCCAERCLGGFGDRAWVVSRATLCVVYKTIRCDTLNEPHLIYRLTNVVNLGLVRKPTLLLDDLRQVFDKGIERQR